MNHNIIATPVPLKLLERAIVGASMIHVDGTLQVRDAGIVPRDIKSAKLDFVLAACFEAAIAGLLETARPNIEVIYQQCLDSARKITLIELMELHEEGAIPGTNLERTIQAWRKSYERVNLARHLEYLSQAVWKGEVDPSAINQLLRSAV